VNHDGQTVRPLGRNGFGVYFLGLSTTCPLLSHGEPGGVRPASPTEQAAMTLGKFLGATIPTNYQPVAALDSGPARVDRPTHAR